jgi:cell wall-associated NlpC family hydrolase
MEPLFTDKNKILKLKTIMSEWVGTPHQHLKAEKGKGADCGLFIAKCLNEMGIIISMDFWEYHPRFWQNITSKELILNYVSKVSKSFTDKRYIMKEVFDKKFIPGDILTFSLRSKLTNHIAVYFGNNFLIHSINKRGVNITDFSTMYKNRLTKVYRICH